MNTKQLTATQPTTNRSFRYWGHPKLSKRACRQLAREVRQALRSIRNQEVNN